MRRSLFSAGVLIFGTQVAVPCTGQELDASGATFLLMPVGGRAVALGQAAVADGGSGESAFWNPAGLARLNRSELALHHASTFASNNTVLAGYISAARFGVFGVSAYLVDFGSQEISIGPGLPIGRISPKNIELLASYATDVTNDLTVGVSYKLIQFRQDCSGNCQAFPTIVGTTHGMDMGAQYAFGRNDQLRLGLAVLHLGFPLQIKNKDQADPLPTQVQIGAVFRIALPKPSTVHQGLDARILLDLRDKWGNYDDPETRLGFELGYADAVHLRTGYAFVDAETSGPSIGFGLRAGRVILDFARQFYLSSNFDEPVYVTLRATL